MSSTIEHNMPGAQAVPADTNVLWSQYIDKVVDVTLHNFQLPSDEFTTDCIKSSAATIFYGAISDITPEEIVLNNCNTMSSNTTLDTDFLNDEEHCRLDCGAGGYEEDEERKKIKPLDLAAKGAKSRTGKIEEGPSFQPVLQQLIRHHTPKNQGWYYRRIHLFDALHDWCCGAPPLHQHHHQQQQQHPEEGEGEERGSGSSQRIGPLKPILLIVGGPGTGKSTFMADLMKGDESFSGSAPAPTTCIWSKERVLVKFICRFTTGGSLDPLTFVRSFDEQLRGHPRLARLYERECKVFDNPDLLTEMRKDNINCVFDGDVCNGLFIPILEILSGIKKDELSASGLRLPLLLVVDSLDESLLRDSGYHSSIAQLLIESLPELPSWLRVVASSRPMDAVIGSLKRVKVSVLHQNLHGSQAHGQQQLADHLMLDGDQANEQCVRDVRNYIEQCLKDVKAQSEEKQQVEDAVIASDSGSGSVVGRSWLNDGTQFQEAVKLLCGKSAGNILYASRVLDIIAKHVGGKRGAGCALPSLDQLRKLSPGLDCMYRDDFTKRFPTFDKFNRVKPLLLVLLAAPWPLTRGELRATMTWYAPSLADEQFFNNSFRQIEDFLKVDTITGRCSLFHYSLAEWLGAVDKADSRYGHFHTPSLGYDSGQMAVAVWFALGTHLEYTNEADLRAILLQYDSSLIEYKFPLPSVSFYFRGIGKCMRAENSISRVIDAIINTILPEEGSNSAHLAKARIDNLMLLFTQVRVGLALLCKFNNIFLSACSFDNTDRFN